MQRKIKVKNVGKFKYVLVAKDVSKRAVGFHHLACPTCLNLMICYVRWRVGYLCMFCPALEYRQLVCCQVSIIVSYMIYVCDAMIMLSMLLIIDSCMLTIWLSLIWYSLMLCMLQMMLTEYFFKYSLLLSFDFRTRT